MQINGGFFEIFLDILDSLDRYAILDVLDTLEVVVYFSSSTAAWAAARRAIGTRKGEQEA